LCCIACSRHHHGAPLVLAARDKHRCLYLHACGVDGERETTLHLHVRGRPRRRRGWPPVGVRCGSKPDEVRKIASGIQAWDHFRDGTCVTASHERSRRGREPPAHPDWTGLPMIGVRRDPGRVRMPAGVPACDASPPSRIASDSGYPVRTSKRQ
jgi:hypothetical protein